MNSCSTPFRLLSTVFRHRPQMVWFNLGFSNLADQPVPAFLGLLTPALLRLFGFHTQVTLHTFIDNVDMDDAGVRWKWLYRVAGNFATRVVLIAHHVHVLLPSYRELLIRKHGGDPSRIHFHAHGFFPSSIVPSLERKEPRVLAFGSWGTYKRLDALLESFDSIAAQVPGAKLMIAGRSHPKTPHYLSQLTEAWKGREWLEFYGYVPEKELGTLFGKASVVAMPYDSSAGSSGVAHQACQFGVPVVATDVPDLREMASTEDLHIEFVPVGDTGRFSQAVINLLQDDTRRLAIAKHNLAAVEEHAIRKIPDRYIQCFFDSKTSGLRGIADQRHVTPAKSELESSRAPL